MTILNIVQREGSNSQPKRARNMEAILGYLIYNIFVSPFLFPSLYSTVV